MGVQRNKSKTKKNCYYLANFNSLLPILKNFIDMCNFKMYTKISHEVELQ